MYNEMLEIDLPVLRTALTIALFASSIQADVLMDQIGPMDGSMVGDIIEPSQYFEPKFAEYDIAVLENFTLEGSGYISVIEVVMDGWNGFQDPSSVTSVQTNIYSTPAAAGNALTGDVASYMTDFSEITVSDEWEGTGFLLIIPTELLVKSAGTYWCSVIPVNPFTTDGQTGLANTLSGDGVLSMQANPGEGFGFGVLQELATEAAIRIHVDTQPNQCDSPLPVTCSEDVNGDLIIDTTDLLAVIATWGEVGDGTLRPLGDVAPLPNGDCLVNLTDILAIISAWGQDCNVYGACCLNSGFCEEEITIEVCSSLDGIYFGDNSSCAEGVCISGACCHEKGNCSDVTLLHCAETGGYYLGDDSSCTSSDCSSIYGGDECVDAVIATLGENLFNTIPMTTSQPQPTDESCSTTNLDWGMCPDMWFSFVAKETKKHRFTLCDPDSYDTSMVLYANGCTTDQIACNGDALSDGDDGPCQLYYSALEHELLQGTTYYIRIGGWQGASGEGTLTIYDLPDPIPGACCFTEIKCLNDMTFDECLTFGGKFVGEKTLCSASSCTLAEGDECDQATIATLGINPFDTTDATPSLPEPSDSMCEESFLNWSNSPDIWMKWIVPDDGVASFSTCDPTSFDTSIVLYEGDCTSQVACNGDGPNDSGCQDYYSHISHDVSAGQVYFVRIGGWQGGTGIGNLHINVVTPYDVGACCISDLCQDKMLQGDCIAQFGTWYLDAPCADVICTTIGCENPLFLQLPSEDSDEWFAGTSSSDSTIDIYYEVAEYVNIASSNSVKVWGFQLAFDPILFEWNECDLDYLFNIRTYIDEQGVPGPLVIESLYVPAVKIQTGQLYAGEYELMQWNIPFVATNIEHISIQSNSEGIDCWFLWMNSQEGDGLSSRNQQGSGWIADENDFSICIE